MSQPRTPLVATKAGFQPGLISNFGAQLESVLANAGEVTLVLAAGAQELGGRLLDTSGEACAGWRIALYDAATISPRAGYGTSAEDLARGADNEQWTDGEGHFQMGGLRADRSYRLRAWNESSLQSYVSDPVPSGSSNYEFVIDLERVHPEVHGQVVGLDGRPLAGISHSADDGRARTRTRRSASAQ